MKENIKLGLLGVIAITLIINTFFLDDTPTRKEVRTATTPQSNVAVTPATGINQLANNPIAAANPIPKPAPSKSESRTKTSVKFTDISHNFGNIQQDTKNTKIFKFTNTGTEPLIIESAKGSCGCTVPKFPKEPILPGKTGDIEVVYSPGKQKGAQNKTVTITANTTPIKTVINIMATVEVPAK